MVPGEHKKWKVTSFIMTGGGGRRSRRVYGLFSVIDILLGLAYTMIVF
jgi:hypothetical protein